MPLWSDAVKCSNSVETLNCQMLYDAVSTSAGQSFTYRQAEKETYVLVSFNALIADSSIYLLQKLSGFGVLLIASLQIIEVD